MGYVDISDINPAAVESSSICMGWVANDKENKRDHILI